MRKILNILAVIIFLASIGFMIANAIITSRRPYGFSDAENTIAPPSTETTAEDTTASDTTVGDTITEDTTVDDTTIDSTTTDDTTAADVTIDDTAAADTTTDDTTAPDTTAEDTIAEDTTTADTDIPEETAAPLVAPPIDLPAPTEEMADKIDTFFSSLDSTEVLLSVGYNISDKVYGDGLRLSLLTREITDVKDFSVSTAIEKEPVRIDDEIYGTYTTELRDKAVNLPFIHIYMDYLLVDNGGSFKVYKNDGSLIYEQFNADEFVPAYTRDKLGRPLFMREEPSQWNPANTITKYYYLDEIGALLESDYDEENDNRGLYINYPTYFGISDNQFEKSYVKTAELYTYTYPDGTKKTEPTYTNAYSFSNGFAATVDEHGVMNFTDSDFRRTIFAYDWSEWYYNHSGRRVRPIHTEPDTRGIESLGFFYFEDGLCRVRRQIVDSYNWEADKTKLIASDRDIIIRTDGTEFPIPTDYTVAAYSNSMILLEKDGYYGYMDIRGKWVVQPIYTHAEPFSEGLAVLGKDGKMGIIDTAGNFLVPMIFDYIERPSGGLIVLFDVQHGWAVMNKCYYPPSDQITE